MNKELIAKKIKELRLFKGYTLMQLSELSGVTHITISNVERGKFLPQCTTLHKLLKALEYDYEKFYEETKDENIY